MKKLLVLTLSFLFLTSVVFSGTAFSAIGTGAQTQFVEQDNLLIDTLHSSADGSESAFAYDGDQIHNQNGAQVTVFKSESNTENAGFVNKFDGTKLVYHGNDSAHNGNSGMNIRFLPGENDISDSVEYLEFDIATNAGGRTYFLMYNAETPLQSLCWADSSFTGGTVRVEIDRRSSKIGSDGNAAVKVFLNGTQTASTAVNASEYGITINLLAYKTPTITISSVKYGFISSVGIPARNYTSHGAELLNTLNTSSTGSAERIVFNGDETHIQNGALVAVKKDAANSADYGFIHKYDGSQLTYHGANDSASNGNSGVTVSFAPGTNDVSNALEYVQFNLKTNAPGRTYAKIVNGTTDIMILNWAESNFATDVDHVIKIEVDRRESALSGDGKASLKVYMDSVLKHSASVAASEYGMGIWLAAYKTPTVTISSVKYGYEKSLLTTDTWINTLHNGGGSGTTIAFNGDETHTQNGATVTVVRDASNTGNGYINKYDGNSLTYHGKDDSASNGNSGVSLVFDKGANDVRDKFEFLQFKLNTNASTRTYAVLYYGSKTLCIIANANGEIANNQDHILRVEIDRRESAVSEGISGKAVVYLNGVDVSRVDIPDGEDGSLRLWLAAYKTPSVVLSGVNYGAYKLNGFVDDIVFDESENVARVKILNPVMEGVGQYGNNVALMVAGYNDNNELISMTVFDGEQIVGEAILETPYAFSADVTVIKAFVWDLESIRPICASKLK